VSERSWRVEIVGDHPHAGCVGWLHPDAPTIHGRVKIELEHCRHLVGGCFAKVENLRKTAHQGRVDE